MVKVHVRVRPASESRGFWASPDTASIELTRDGRCHSFKYDSVLANASQDDVYERIGKQAVQDALSGFNTSVIAYGQSGSGKSYGISGVDGDFERRGLVPRAISDLFASIASKASEISVVVRVSAVELQPDDSLVCLLSGNRDLEILTDESGGVTLRGARSEISSSEQEVLTQWFLSEGRRTVGGASAGHRAHGIFIATLEIKNRTDLSGRTKIAKLVFADLAGGERAKSEISAAEISGINRSLSFLEQVVISASKVSAHVPYRSSRLTQILREAIGGRAKTSFLVCVDPRAENFSATLSSLRFAAKATRVENSERTIEVLTDAQVIRNLETETRQLRRELQLHDHLAGRATVGTFEPLTAEDLRDLQVTAEQFLSGNLETVEVNSLRQVQELFAIFRKLYRKFPEASEAAKAAQTAAGGPNDPAQKSRTESLKTNDPANNVAPDDLRPPNSLATEDNAGANEGDKLGGNANPFSALALYKTLTAKNERLKHANAQTAFEVFLASETELRSEHAQLIEQLKERRRTLKETQVKCNEIKASLVEVSERREDLKRAHKENLDLVSLLKSEIESIGNRVDQLKLEVVSRFNEWYSRQNLEKPIPKELKKKVESENDTVFRKSLNNAKILHSRLATN